LHEYFSPFFSEMLRREHHVNIRYGSEIQDTRMEGIHGKVSGERNTRIIWSENNLRNVRFEDLMVRFGSTLKKK
jgi:hypothetical protein